MLTPICNTNTALSADCPTAVTIAHQDESVVSGECLGCTADRRDPTYTWTGTVNGEQIVPQTGVHFCLSEGDFDLTCTATVSQAKCTSAASDSMNGTAIPLYGKCHIII